MRAFLPAAMLLASCAGLPGNDDTAARSLAAAESAFAAQSVREDMRSAFLAHFAPDGVMVRGAAWQPAREWLQPRPAPPIVLDWRPVYVEVARSGDLGLSTGPWRITPRGGTAPTDFGQFVSIWTRAPGGPWRVAVDLGISHPAPDLWEAPLAAHASRGIAGRDTTLEEAEAAFSQAASRDGLAAAWSAWGAADLRVYREGRTPFLGAEAVAAGHPDDAHLAFTAERSATAASGDFGYARGHAGGGSAAAPFLHVWRREREGWRLALDVLNPPRR